MILLAFAPPALAQSQGMPVASPAMMPDRLQGDMQGGMMMPVEQSDKDMMAAMTEMKDISMPASLIKTAGLKGMTAPGGKYTLFVASDTFLKTLSPDTRSKMMDKVKDRQMGAEFVRGHLIDGMVTPDQMTDGMTLTMMNGDTMKVGRIGGRITLDDDTVIKAVSTGNGMIYVMDRPPLKQR